MKPNMQCDVEEEVSALRDICRRQEHDMDSLRKHTEDLKIKLEHSEAVNDELRGKIRFLEGQIDAYQYCMNCRR